MLTATALRREVTRLRALLPPAVPPADPRAALLRDLRADPALILARGGMPPDRWQTATLRSTATRTLLLCSRQTGKSTAAAALALREALTRPGALVLLLSPSLRQSGELFRDKLLRLYDALGRPVPPTRQTALTLELANGSRIISLPENEEGIRGYSGVRMLIVDEASRVQDGLYFAIRPMLAVSGGALVALSTPFGKRGWFYESWSGSEPWARVKITADRCPRIAPAFLAAERSALGERWFQQEYMCGFEDAIGAVFLQADIDAAVTNDVLPLVVG